MAESDDHKRNPVSPGESSALDRAEAALRASEARHEALVHELNHRVKNTLAMVQAVARQSFRGASDPAIGLAAFEGRLGALARAHNVLAHEGWGDLDLSGFIATALEPWGHDRFSLGGPPVTIGPQLALSLAMAIHELCTNAERFGALSSQSGHIAFHWTVADGEAKKVLRLDWAESGGPAVSPPIRKGFGSKLLQQAFGAEPDYRPAGIVCALEARLN